MNQPKETHHYPYPPNYPYHQAVPSEDEIDLKELILSLWKGKWLIIFVTFLFSIGGVLFAISQPNTYQASVTLASASAESNGGISGMASQFGGLASLAGINLGSGNTDNKAMAIAVLKSRQFINAFINEHDLLVPLFAGTEWQDESKTLMLNPELYNSETKMWLLDAESQLSLRPSDWNAYKVFKSALSISEEKDTGLVTISVTHLSPVLAQQWVTWLIEDLNAWMKSKSLEKSRRNIEYIEMQLDKTHIEDMRSVFYQLIEEQTKNLMLAEVEEEFAFQTIDPAVIPEEKIGPKRALICVLATLLGGMLGVTIVLIRMMFKKKEVDEIDVLQAE